MYAHATDGLDHERRDEFDRVLNAAPGAPADTKAKAQREREAVARALGQMVT